MNKASSKFVKPTPAEAAEYAGSIGFKLDGQLFCDHYEARGWRYSGGVKMVCWRAAVRTWKKRAGKHELFDVTRQRNDARRLREESDARYAAEYAEKVTALRSWRGVANGPYGDVELEERRLLAKVRDNFGSAMVRRVLDIAKGAK